MTPDSILSLLTLGFTLNPTMAPVIGSIPAWVLALAMSLAMLPLMTLVAVRISNSKRQGSTAIESEVQERTRALEEYSQELKLVNLRLERQMRQTHEAAEERRVLENRVQQSQRLESLGVLAGGIAHDFNNLLVGIMGNAELALHEADPDSGISESLRDIIGASDRAADLCKQMLAYAGKSPFKTGDLDLNAVILSIKGLIETSFENKIRVDYDLAEDLCSVGADRAQIEQAIINLVTNGAEAIDGEGIITLRTGRKNCTDGFFEERSYPYELPAGEYNFLEVSDTGRGMSKKIQQRIFEPFFTTKFMGRGLGLAAAFGIVRRHHGAITVASLPGRGSRFTLYFPASQEAAQLVDTRQGARQLNLLEEEITGRVLIVDDEEMVRTLAAMALNRDGISTVLAEDGVAGLKAVRELGAEIGCVLLDMTMPRMDGQSALVEIKRLEPSLPVVIMSGHSERQLSSQLENGDVFDYLSKPFAIEQLRTVIKQALISRTSSGEKSYALRA